MCSRFLLQVADNLLHDRVNLLVVKRFRLVLQEEADRVRLFALREVLSFIDVEEFDGLEELALAVGSDFPDSVERYCLVDEEGEEESVLLTIEVVKKEAMEDVSSGTMTFWQRFIQFWVDLWNKIVAFFTGKD